MNRGIGGQVTAQMPVRMYPDVIDLKGSVLPLLDIGPGRAEWLELLRDNDIPAYGIDTNEDFVGAAGTNARNRGLSTEMHAGARTSANNRSASSEPTPFEVTVSPTR